ncbi:MAG TPA: response regulator transcription factor [Moraxellaceae bacterium]
MKIIMVGKPDLQTDLLLGLIRQNITPDCCLLGEDELPLAVDAHTLYILDLAVLDPYACASALNTLNPLGKLCAALINVGSGTSQVRLAALPGVRGLFPQQASAEEFLRGIKAILTGEYWLPRHVLCAHLEQTRQLRPAQSFANAIKLSPKERQILGLLTQGCSNDAIADRLAISPHTVKTHFYNLYRKLQVRNRVQAATWAQQNSAALEDRL